MRLLWWGPSLRQVAGIFRISTTTFWRICQHCLKFGRGGLICVKPPGHPKTETTINAMRQIQQLIAEGRKMMVRGLSAATGVSAATGRRILSSLGFKSLVWSCEQKVTTKAKKLCVARATKLLTLLKHKCQHAVVLLSDEAFIDLAPDKNSCTDQVIVQSVGEAMDLGLIHEWWQRESGLMLWGVITSDGKSQLPFSEKGVKVNNTLFCTKMEGHLSWLNKTYQGFDTLCRALWVHDSVLTLASHHTQIFLWGRLRDPSVRLVEKSLWPANSPDPNPLDSAI